MPSKVGLEKVIGVSVVRILLPIVRAKLFCPFWSEAMTSSLNHPLNLEVLKTVLPNCWG